MSTCGFLMVFAGLVFALGCLMAAPWFHLAIPVSFVGVLVTATGFALMRGPKRRSS